jgi:hypothetical protein
MSRFLNREDRYRETRVAYENTRSVENAASLRAAINQLRSKQKEYGVTPEPTEALVSQAFSQLRPSK